MHQVREAPPVSTTITLYLDDATEARLRVIAKHEDRKVEDLAEASVSEAALNYFRGRVLPRDPAPKAWQG
jgi:predicted transcriptional regulator